jgi:hypothetical protein
MNILDPPPLWVPHRSRHLILWHGCTTSDKDKIEAAGVDPMAGRPNTDFGRGFYTTTIEQQARQWAWTRYYNPKFRRSAKIQPAVLRFKVDRHKLAKLKWLSFVGGDYDNDDFWSLVHHCRTSTPEELHDHGGPVAEEGHRWYDVVSGPVAAFWEQRSAMHDADQISFHTRKAAQLLTDLIRSGDLERYCWQTVVE